MNTFLAVLLTLSIALVPAPIAEVENIHNWTPFAEDVRVTYYGPYFKGGETTASGEIYYKDKALCAVGKEILQELRVLDSSAPGTFLIKPCFKCEGDTWGWYLRLTMGNRTQICQVLDTGASGLEIDLPDYVWGNLANNNFDIGVLSMKVEVFR
jgi:hypothetical protein